MVARQEMTREEITKHVKQVIKMEMLKKDMNFVELQKVMKEHGYNYSLDAIRQKVGRGTYDARFLYEFAESMDLDIEFVKKQV
jgi:ABC-type bacteriocin/lantibiotic exporter with double-glycine peptidase domain